MISAARMIGHPVSASWLGMAMSVVHDRIKELGRFLPLAIVVRALSATPRFSPASPGGHATMARG
jgi:hypothetical protein